MKISLFNQKMLSIPVILTEFFSRHWYIKIFILTFQDRI